MAKPKVKTQDKHSRKSDLPMNDRVPGGMPEAMVKGALVKESNLDHGQVSALSWGEAVGALIKARGGNYTYNEAKAQTDRDDRDEDVPVITSLAEKPKVKTKKKKKKSQVVEPAIPEVEETEDHLDAELDALLDEVTEPYEPSIEESGSAMFIGMPTTRDYIFDGHAGAGPSGASRWMNCTASLAASRAFLETLTPNQQREYAKGSEAARQGTTAHAAAESEARLMLGQITETEHENNLFDLSMTPTSEAEAYDEEMGEWLTEYGDLLRQYHQAGHEVLIEERVVAAIPLMTVDSDGDQDVHEIMGSADAISLPTKDEPVLTVADLKYGNGKNVEAEDNPQAMIYALAVLAKLIEMGVDIFDPKVLAHIELVIVQPRLGGIKTWTITVDELLTWQDEVLSPALTEALGGFKGGAKYTPSDEACEWCPARGNCAALLESRVEAASDLFEVIQDTEHEQGVGAVPNVTGLDAERLATLLSQAEGLVSLRDELKAEAQRRLHRGEHVPGRVLVNYQPPRSWVEDADQALDPSLVDEDLLDPVVADTLWKRSLLSPTQAVKALKAAGLPEDALDKMIVKPDKRPVVAREGDRRSLWEAVPPEQMFDDETGA